MNLDIPNVNNSYFSFYNSNSQKQKIPFLAEYDFDRDVFAYDDMISQQNRAFIREHISQNSPYAFIQDDEKERQKIISTAKNLVENKEKPINKDMLKNFVEFEEDIYKGIVHPVFFEYLKKAGIETVVSLAPCLQNAKAAKKIGLKYFPTLVVDKPFNMSEAFLKKENYIKLKTREYPENDALSEKRKTDNQAIEEFYDTTVREYIENEFIPFIKTMQEGKIYIGCSCGQYRTADAIILNSWFNSKCKNKFITPENRTYIERFKNLFDNLTKEDKKKLGFNKLFEKEFLKNVRKYENL